MQEYDDAKYFADFTPSVFWFVDDDCLADGTCDADSELGFKWRELQKDVLGTAFYHVNIDDLPQVAVLEDVTYAPYFKNIYGSETVYAGDADNWIDFRAIVIQTNKLPNELEKEAAADGAAVTTSTTNPVNMTTNNQDVNL